MIIKVTKIATRPNNLIEWNKNLNFDIISIINEYINNKKLIGRHQILEDNTNKIIQFWNNLQSYESYLKDFRLQDWFKNINDYREKNKIIVTPDIIESVDENIDEVFIFLNKFTIKNKNGEDVPISYFMK